jgi:exonuclease III
MKLITLNLWGGIVYEPLMEFIKKHSVDTDVFCFQEMIFGDTPGFTEQDKARINLFTEISTVLSEFHVSKRITKSDHFQRSPIDCGVGQTIFVRKNLVIKEEGGFYCYDTVPHNTDMGGKITGNLNWVLLEHEGEEILVANLHGLWQMKTSAQDTPERLIQSQKIKDFLNKRAGKKILCGDFNLVPDGKSVAILGEGMRNLVIEAGSPSTRSQFYTRNNKCSDYIIISPEIKVKEFQVLQDQISDHLPVYIEFT